MGPAFLEAAKIDIAMLKKYTYEDVLFYKETSSESSKT